MDHINNPAHNTFMAMAITAMQRTALAERSGEPFGAVIVKNNELVAVAGNSVGRDNDPPPTRKSMRFALLARY